MLTNKANQYFKKGHLDKAKKLCLQELGSHPGDMSTLSLLAQIYLRQGETDNLIETLTQAHSLAPLDQKILYRLGEVLRDHGKFSEARDAFIKALALQPGHSGIYQNLTSITHYSERNKEVATMEAMYARTTDNSRQRKELAFALGKVFDDLGEHDKAFGFFHEGNSIAYKAIGHSPEADISGFAQIRKTFDAAFFERYQKAGLDNSTPIFISGLPRSGTTLVEQILASHPEVCGAGELSTLHNMFMELAQTNGSPFPTGFDRLGKRVLRKVTRAYLAEQKSLSQGKAHVTNKSITNFIYLGLIGIMMPNAIIIDCRRDPRDQGLSLFQKDFEGQQYGYDLKSIGTMYRLYSDLFEHWEQFLPVRVYRIQYEDLVTDPDTSIRNLLAHCKLSFDNACLSFYQTKRAVLTASRMQVRRPVYQDAMGRWKNYEKHLAPLITALEMDAAAYR